MSHRTPAPHTPASAPASAPAAGPLRDVVLVGGGHSHVQLLRMQAMDPLPGARLTVVVDRHVAVYSGMVPAFVAGQVSAHDLSIDVRPLARQAGVRFIQAACTGIDPVGKRVQLQGRPPLAYDLCSLNVGSVVSGTDLPGVAQHTLPTRPIGRFTALVEERIQAARGRAALDVIVVGGGAGGVELAFCLDARLRAEGVTASVTLVDAGPRLFASRSPRLSRRLAQAAARRGIAVIHGHRVTACLEDAVVIDDGRRLPSGLTVWVTGAQAPSFLADSGLPTEHRGFVWVQDDLQVRGHNDLFAVGDCAALVSWPEIPKAGVYAVRQGPVLLANLRRALLGQPLQAYRPQRRFLTLLNLGDGTAIADRGGGFLSEGRWVARLKERIDRRFMEKFQVLQADGSPAPALRRGMPRDLLAAMDAASAEGGEMVCGGCAAKVAETPLRRALARLPAQTDATVSMGLDATEDVAAMQLSGLPAGQVLVANLDAFTAFTDDPWLVGQVGAHNALSDLFATGLSPRYAMAFVTIPTDAQPEETLFQVMSGVRRVLAEHGVTLVGGHTTVGPQLVVGLSVWGTAAEAQLWSKGGLQPGQALVISRALGTGVLFHADMAGRARGSSMAAATAGMLRGNAIAAGVGRAVGVAACTDVTGFGLAGHLGELLRASACSAQLQLDAIPALPGALDLLALGERSSFHAQNLDLRKALFVSPHLAAQSALDLIFDPQTAGGLLFGVDAARASALVTALQAAGEVDAAVIGQVTPARQDKALFSVSCAWAARGLRVGG